MTVARLAGVPLDVSRTEATPPLERNTSSARELLPSLRRRILRAAKRCSVTDLKQCLAEAETAGPASAAAVVRRGLRSYDMDLIVQSLGDTPPDEEER